MTDEKESSKDKKTYDNNIKEFEVQEADAADL